MLVNIFCLCILDFVGTFSILISEIGMDLLMFGHEIKAREQQEFWIYWFEIEFSGIDKRY